MVILNLIINIAILIAGPYLWIKLVMAVGDYFSR